VLSEAANEGELERARRAAEERRLVEAAVRGSVASFEQLYRLHSGRVYGLCLRMTGHRETAEDCTQEAFIQAWRSLPRFE
jgi:RNA polymerase sigma-70 factor (ECF subfamily)